MDTVTLQVWLHRKSNGRGVFSLDSLQLADIEYIVPRWSLPRLESGMAVKPEVRPDLAFERHSFCLPYGNGDRGGS